MPNPIDLDISAALAALEALSQAGPKAIKHLAEAVAMAAFKAERQAKEAATEMIYQKAAERGGYVRTGTLRRSIMAAHPDHDHSNDEANARAGQELGTADMAIVKQTAKAIEVAVGSWISYAELVNDGTRYMNPRPFMDEGLKTAEADLEHFVLVALDDILREILG